MPIIGQAENFTCSSLNLSRENATELVWTLQAEDAAHRQSVTSVAAFQIIFLVMGIPWNVLVIAAILKNKLFTQPSHLLLLNLAVSDLMVCVFFFPFNILISLAGRVIIGSTDYVRCQVCHTYVITIIIMIYLSLFTVAAMSVDRLIYIKYPLKYSVIVTVKKMLVVILVMWIVCILIGLPPVFGLGEISFSNIVGTCSIIFSAQTRVAPSAYYIALLVCVALFPVITTIIANVWLLFIVRRFLRVRHRKKMTTVKNCPSQLPLERMKSVHNLESTYNKQQIFLAQVFGAIFVVNIFTWIPTVFIAVASGAVGADNVPPEAFSFVFLAFLSQPAIHPILESFLASKVREAFLKYLCCCRRKIKK